VIVDNLPEPEELFILMQTILEEHLSERLLHFPFTGVCGLPARDTLSK
jgi:hypothetical protein